MVTKEQLYNLKKGDKIIYLDMLSDGTFIDNTLTFHSKNDFKFWFTSQYVDIVKYEDYFLYNKYNYFLEDEIKNNKILCEIKIVKFHLNNFDNYNQIKNFNNIKEKYGKLYPEEFIF